MGQAACSITSGATSAVTKTTSGEDFFQEVHQCFEGAPVGRCAIAHGVGMAALLGFLVGEAVHHATIEMQLPVHLTCVHFLGKCFPDVWPDHRVIAADANQHLALDVLGVPRPLCAEAAVKTSDTLDVGPAARQFQRDGAAEQ